MMSCRKQTKYVLTLMCQFEQSTYSRCVKKATLNSHYKTKRHFTFISIMAVLFIFTLFASRPAYAASDDQKVYDYYGLFTEEEAASLENTCKQYGEKGQVDIVMISIDNLDGKTRMQYLEDFYDEQEFGYNQKFGDAVLILINMDPSDRGVEIQGYGIAKNYVNDDRIEHILDDIVPKLSDGNYYKAMIGFSKQVAYYMNHTDAGDYYVDPSSVIFFNTFFQLAVALVIGAVVVGIMAFESGGKITVNNRTYLDEPNSGVIANLDDYIRTTTTRIKKPTNNNSGGGRSSGGGGVSSGGNSHSGGGRSF